MDVLSYLRIQVVRRGAPDAEIAVTATLLVLETDAYNALCRAVHVLYHNGWTTRRLDEFRVNIPPLSLETLRGAEDLREEAVSTGVAWRIKE